MLVHVTISGKKTTVSIDDVLMDYLGAWIVRGDPSLYGKAKRQQQEARKCVRDRLVKMNDAPSKNLSQFIQECIIRLIVDEQLTSILDVRGDPYKAPSRKLDDESLMTWSAMAGLKSASKEQIVADLLNLQRSST